MIQSLLAKLDAAGVRLRNRGGELAVSGNKAKIDAALIGEMKLHKAALLELIGAESDLWWSPPAIRPEMLTLVELTQGEIDEIVSRVPGGAKNVQDIYPLAPLQEGIFFHHLLATEGDPYLICTLFSFETRERLDAYVGALRAALARHDIFRTAIVWQGLREPVQVVLRQAPLVVEEVELDPAAGSVAAQLYARFDPRHHRIDLGQAPLVRAHTAWDEATGRWQFLLLMHHLAGDHTTLDVLRGEVSAHLHGRVDQLPAALPFRNLVAQARLGVSRAEHEAFFTGLLGEVDEPTAPFGMLDVQGDGRGIAEAHLDVDPALSLRLRDRARVLGVSAASLCYVAFAQLLARVSGREDVVFGTVLFGRMQGGAGADRVMGPFINTLPMRVRIGDAAADATVRGVQTLLADLLRHEHASLALAQRCSGVQAPAPLFSALLNYRHSAPAPRAGEARPAGDDTRRTEERTNYPLTLSVDDQGEGFSLTVQVLESAGAERVCGMMHRALESLAGALESAPATPVRALPVLPDADRVQVVETWNATDAEFPRDTPVHELFAAQVRRAPAAVAVVCDDGQLTYAELDERANRLAHHLVERGVAPGERVAVLVPRSLELVVAELAVLKAGAAYVPVDPTFPADRVAFMVADSGARIVLGRAGEALPELAGTARVDVDALPEGHAEDPRVAVGSEAAAYVMYTSGSTGAPKGVVVPHRAIARLVINSGFADFDADDRVAFSSNPAFDATTMEVWAPLLNGGRIVVIAQDTLLDPRRFGDALTRHGVNVLWMTVGLFNQYADELRNEIPRLRYLIVGGDALDPRIIARVLREHAPRHLLNGYGPTETTTFAITHAITDVADGARGIPLGRPISNTRIYILDAQGEPVPAGVAGEMYIAGAGVALGYLNRPELTEERFVADRFSGEPGARMYRTGDLGRWLPDGTIEFLGRNDFQVKIRGFRIELGEIEARLAEHARIGEAVVLARQDAPGDKRLVAYYVAPEAVDAETLRAHLRENLPEYMVPAAYVWMERLPLTSNGKLDRRALPAPDGDAFATGGYEAPAGEMEETLAGIWAGVLRVERVGRNDHFFELGGHSLLAVQAISRVRQVLGIEVALGDLFARPVLADFARGLNTAARAALAPIEPGNRGGDTVALSFAQQRLWFLEQLGSAGSAYHIPTRLRLQGELDRIALGRALDRIVERHEVLRTVFREVNGQPVQVIATAAESVFHLVEHDFRGHADPQAELRRLSAQEVAAPFDLEHGPLIRGRLVKLADDDHVLMVTMHHIVSDGWSMGLVTSELSALYAAYRAGGADPLAPLPVQYADYSAWQRRWVDGEVLQQQVDYWKTTLAGAPELLEVPTDHVRPLVQSHAGATVGVELDERLTAGLKALSQRHGTTLYMTLMAGWATVLSRLSGQDDVVIGTPTANRGRKEIESLIGFFVNTLALRMDLSGTPTVAELLGRVKERALGAQDHQDIPFEQVVELVQPARSMAHTPLFQVMFTWQSNPKGSLALPGLKLGSTAGAARTTAMFDLSLSLQEAGGRIVGGLEYATALFEQATVERYLGYLRMVLEAMAADERQTVDRLAILPAAERVQVVETFNATDAEFPSESCIHHLFEAQVERTPDAIAVAFEDTHLTYRELNARANQLAHYLRERGVGPDARVGICVERSVEMMVALLGVLKAGGGYVPLDAAYPEDRLRHMLTDSAPVVLLTQGSLAGLFAWSDVPRVDLFAFDGSDRPAGNPEGAARPDQLAYVIYTSGSTGMPKGVMNEHRGVVNRLVWMQAAYGLQPDEAVLQKTPFSFDVSVWEFFWALLAGARVVMARPEGHKDPAYLVEAIRSAEISTLHFVPSMLQLFLEHAEVESCTGLRQVMCSGEALPVALVRRFHERLPGVELHNLYGPTEAAVDVTAWHCTPEATKVRVPIGKPIWNTRMYVLDAAGEPVPVGVTGELFIGGVQVARGYLNRDELTAERFVRDPFTPGGRLYRTGDLGRWLADGSIEYLGRNDFQVKIRGFRIELGEIESRLAEHAEVREAVVLAWDDGTGDKRLVAYYAGAAAVDTAGLRAHLGEHLPEHMVPAAYVWLERLPLTPNGKVDRKALPAPEVDAGTARVYEAPEGEIEETLAEIWSGVLGVERVGRRDSFFALGGHSLRAVQVVSRVRQMLGLDASLGDIFQRPVLADFARGLASAARSDLPAIVPAERGERMPLSFAQQRLWFLEQLGRAGRAYHMPTRLRLRGELDRVALARALDRIVERHEALRTTFHTVDGEPVQVIAPARGFALVHHDVSAQADAEAALRRIVAEESAAAFDLEHGPLVRGCLVKVAEDDHALLVTMHHIVSDGWSMGVLTRELSTLYGAFRDGAADPLPALPVQYADYAAWQRKWVDGEVLQQQVDYWKTMLTGAPELLELPADRPRPAQQSHAGAAVGVELSEELTAGLKALSQRHGTTLFMTLMAGWATVLSRLSGQDDVVIGTPTANRGRREIEGLIGFFVNTLAVRMDLGGAPTVAELLGRVKERTLGAQDHQDIPFEQVVELVQPARSMAHTPLFQAMFTWQNNPKGSLELPGLKLGGVGAEAHTTAKFDLSLSMQEAGGRVVGGVTYATALFEEATVERYLGYLRSVLEAMVADERQTVDRLPLLPAAERARMVEEWNATGAGYPDESCIHELFEAQVERTPNAVALVFDDARLTYAELNARANRLAHHLREGGVGPDARVAVCVERGVEMVVGLLGVLKAGGAYVPLDPAYPHDRLRYMLGDSAPIALLTQSRLAGMVATLAGGLDVPVIHLDEDAEWAGRPESNPERGELTPDRLMYVIYTSGSTGLPKGVMNQHRCVVNRLVWGQRAWALEEGDAVLQNASFSFDVSVRELFWPLMAGGRVVMLRPEGARDPGYLVETIRRERVRTACFVPSMLQIFLEHRDAARCAGLRRVVCSGEALPASVARRFHERLPGVALDNVYGPSEAATAIASLGCAADDTRATVPIGHPISNTRVYVLDAAGEPVPAGVTGELYIGGTGVARGYFNRPELTAERFVADTFSGEPGARLYRTGDLARWLADGSIEFLGRNDFQVKLRGFRIELGEIESRLAQHGDVREAVVLVREDVPGDQRLVAYYVGSEAAGVDTLRAYLGEHLPEYMVPAAYVRLEAMPLTPNGKADRKAMPAPGGAAFSARGFEAPLGDTEETLAAIWAGVLGVERVGRRDSFFALGGHSLLAVQVVSRVRQAMGVSVALGDLFVHPVLADFARGLETAARAELPPIVPAERGDEAALSFAQQRLWFLEQLGSAGRAYHMPTRLRLRGELDRDALVRALDRIVERHEALRTTFHSVDGQPVQRIAPAAGFALARYDLSAHADAEAELRALVTEESGAAFDLEHGPLVRGRLVRMAEDDHVLLVTMHHIVSDGWSMGVLTNELSTLYTAFQRGDADPLPALPVQYADYAAWQRKWVDGEVLQQQVDYWKTTLSGAPELLEIPADHARPLVQSHAGAALGLMLDKELTAGLKALSQRHGTTLFMTLMAAWATVLSRLSGQDDVVIGTPTANRGRREIEALIGFFVNTLAVRVDFSGAPTVAELLGRVKERALGAQDHQDIPFEQVVELVQPARSMAHSPLFQAMFTWQNNPKGSLELPGLKLGSVGAAAHTTAKFDLSLDLQEAGGCIVGGVTYATSLFEEATIERYLGYLRMVLEAMVADEQQTVDRLPLLSAAERLQVVETFNATDAEFPADVCIHELFEARAERTPNAVAVVYEDRSLTYAELNARANRLAHHLRERGVGPDARVAICVERGPEMVVGLLAVLKAGGAYVPLDPAYPADRLRHMVEDSAPVALLTQAPLAGVVASLTSGLDLPVIDLSSADWNGEPATNLERGGLTPEHLAYIIYTSGSTGLPKGVMIEHRSLANHTAWQCAEFGIDESDTVLQRTSISFDASVWELWTTLAAGARMVLLPADAARDPAAMARVVEQNGVTIAQFVPALLQAVLHGMPSDARLSCRYVFCGGEALPATLVAEARARGVGEVVNLYGPTEATIDSTSHVCRGEGQPPIGRPVANARVYILGTSGEPVPVGVTGELYVGGAGVARGYLNRPELTAERFLDDPFSGGRMYRTGDLGRWLADGSIEYLGRNDFQVKIRGFRIELGEIEARLAAHAEVREAVVLAREDETGDRRLVAYYTGTTIDTAELRAHLGEHLPEHMVPATYVWLDALPLTPNGKVNRNLLPAPELEAGTARGYEAPEGEVEEALAGIWSSVLGVERVGRRDSFFALGGHSLRAVQVISRVRQMLGVDAALGDLFARPVLADFARGLASAARSDLPAIVPAERGAEVALSFAQQRLWFLEQLGGTGRAYHMPTRLRLRGELDRDALVRALDRIVERHEALRTTFHSVDGQPVQRIAPAQGFALVQYDLRNHADAEAELRALVADESVAAFDLEHGPLIRGRLVRMAADDHVLLVTMHHIVSDGWSMGVLTGELSTLYTAFQRGDADPLAPLPVQYADYAAWQRKWVDGEVLQQQVDYWKTTLSGAPELLELPTDHVRPLVQSHAGAVAGVELDEELTAGLKALSQRHGTTLFMTLMAAWATVLSRLSGQDDVVIGTPTANRGRREIESLIGFFVNTLAVRMDLSGAPTVAELLGRVKERALGAQDHQDIPFEQVVDLVQPARSMAHSPLFQVSFAWQNNPKGSLELPGLKLGSVGAAAHTTAKFDLALEMQEAGGRIVGGVTYATSLFEEATIERYLGYLRTVLAAMAADEQQTVDRLPLLSAGERRQVVEEWNATDAEFPRHTPIHELVQAQAERAPQAIALVHDDRTLTYAELDARANQLANYLRTRGVAADDRVAVLVPRSLELVVAELGVLKAGAVYVPIDPSAPAERIAYMVADSGSRVMLGLQGAALAELPGVERVDVDALPADLSTEDPRVARSSDEGAYVMYTSGSTGQPKGVLVPHRAIARLLINNGYAEFNEQDRVAFGANPAFDATTVEVWAPLLHGGRIVVVAQGVLLDPDALTRLLAEEGVTVLFLTTAIFNQHAATIPHVLAGLRYVLTGGEAADPSAFARVLREGGTAALVNCYGPTEAATMVTTHRVTHVAEGARSIPLGRPLSNTRIYIVDAQGEPVPAGVKGEILAGGPGVALGYLGRPELTEERFITDRFTATPGARLYRTGDLGRWLPDGTIEYLGRNDFQVKIRGFRIELGEIEARLAAHEEIREVAVLAREDVPGDKRLVAYYVGAAGVEALRAHVAEHLPDYMVPSAFVRLDALPLTLNGKVDRKALPAPEGDVFAARAYEAPLGDIETAVAEIWSELLRAGQVGRRDNFFSLGGHSLLAVQVISRVRQALAVDVTLGELFLRPVLADFARGLETATHAELPAIVPAERGTEVALSFAQQRLWFLEQMGSAGRAYHMPTRLRLRGELDRDALVRALDRIVERHEALRTTFHSVDGQPVQRIAPASGFALVQYDLSGYADAKAELRQIVAEESAAAFDLEHGPLVRGRLVKVAADDHVLLVTMHHIVSDGWSMGVLTNELSTLYTAFQRGAADPLAPLPVQYADYAAWQRKWVDGEVLQQQVDYWKTTLTGAPELLELPTDHVRPLVQSHAGASAGLELDEELTTGLKALSQRHGTTLFMTLMAAWATVLGRLSGQEDVVIGTPTANRGRREIEGLIGFFVNTLAVRMDLSGAPTVAELLGRVKERALGAQDHQDIPFEQVVDLVQPARSMAHSPLFQVMFTWQNNPKGSLELPGLRLSSVGGESQATAKFDLSLTLQESGGRIVGGVTYATSLFEEATIERYLGYLRMVLEAMVADEQQTVDRLPLLPAAERVQVVETFNATGAEFPADACIHELFEARAERTPNAVAVVYEGRSLTYAELNARANRLAHDLRERGVGPDARVGICAERGPEMVIGLLAVLKAGGAYVPLDPGYPADRLRHMVEDSAPVALLTQAPLACVAAALKKGLAMPVIDLAGGDWTRKPATNLERGGLTPEHLAYIIYTSGSTGLPKGVMIEHRSLVNHTAWQCAEFGIDESDTVLQRTSISFDASVWELWTTLAAGARMVLLPADAARDPAAMARVVEQNGVTIAQFVPALLQAVLHGMPSDARLSCRYVFCGGEALPATLVAEARARGVGEVVNLYGPTEATIDSTSHVCRGEGQPPIGRPVANARVYILGTSGEPVPVGVTGELYVGGAGVARGYLNRPELTAERFLDDPFSGGRMYRTGDLGRWLPNGSIEYLGRNDFQVKIRGFRIELGEIEARLAAHAKVLEAVVLARADETGDKRLVAYYVGAAEADVLRASLAEQLPEYMIPSVFMRMDALPLTPNGKLDRKALPAPEFEAAASRGFEAPVGEVETALAEIWSGVLGVERIGRGDNFFEMGGHSLRAVQVISRVRQVLNIEATLGDLFARPVLADFARGLETAVQAELGAIVPAERGDEVALSFAQQRLWFLEQLGSAGRAYHMPTRLRLRGELDRDALVRALDRIVERHEALRTTFHSVDGQPVQRIAPASGFALVQHDLCGRADAEAELRQIVAEESAAAFDLEHGPLVRGRLVRMAADDHVLLVTMHHIVSDGWSMGVLTNELSTLYTAFQRGAADPLAPLPVQYADYAAWQRNWVDGEILQQQVDYWKTTLSGAPELLELPTDHVRPLVQSHAGASAWAGAGRDAHGRHQGARAASRHDALHDADGRLGHGASAASRARRMSSSARRRPTAGAARSRG